MSEYHGIKPQCPHCEQEIDSIIEQWRGYYKNRDNFKCNHCGKPFYQRDDGTVGKFDRNTTVR